MALFDEPNNYKELNKKILCSFLFGSKKLFLEENWTHKYQVKGVFVYYYIRKKYWQTNVCFI